MRKASMMKMTIKSLKLKKAKKRASVRMVQTAQVQQTQELPLGSTSPLSSSFTARSACLTRLQKKIITGAVKNLMKMRVRTPLDASEGSGRRSST